jgi:hypothetical protein
MEPEPELEASGAPTAPGAEVAAAACAAAITTTLGLEMGSATRSGGEKTAQSTAEEGVPPEDVPRAQGPAAVVTTDAPHLAAVAGVDPGGSGGSGSASTAGSGPIFRAVTLSWLRDFVEHHRGTVHSWSAREYLAPSDGGGGTAEVVVSLATLGAHRQRRRIAESERSGQPVQVCYSGIAFEQMLTTDVVECFVRSVGRGKHLSYAAAEIPPRCLGAGDYFVSHAWGDIFVQMVEGALAHLEGAAAEETRVWLDIFAINQDDTGGVFAAMGELDDGRTLAEVIRRAQATLVILDGETLAALRRLWCLYEIGATPLQKLRLVPRGCSEADIAQHLRTIDAESALCFSAADRDMIRREICEKFGYGTLARFTQELQLRFLLRPMSYDADVRVLQERGSREVHDFSPVRVHLETHAAAECESTAAVSAARAVRGGGQLACVVGGFGEGKSTLSAAMLPPAEDIVDAWHFCKRADATRQDPVAIVSSLAYQLAQRLEQVRAHILALEPADAERAQVDADAARELLLLQPLRQLTGRAAVVLVDAVDEAGDERRQHSNVALALIRKLGEAQMGALSVILTTRPEPDWSLRALRSSWGEEQTLCLRPDQLRVKQEAAAAEAVHGDAAWAAALQAHEQSKIYQIVTREFARRWRRQHDSAAEPLPPPPPTVDAAYALWFDTAVGVDDDVRAVLGLTMAACVPPKPAVRVCCM